MKRPIFMLGLINIIAFVLLYFYREPLNVKTLYVGLSVLALTFVTYGIIYFYHLGDEYLFLIVSMHLVLGVAMLCRINYELGIKQIAWYIIAICVFYISYAVYRYINIWNRLKYFYIGISVFLFVATLIFGTTVAGAKNWIYITSEISFQPSEFIKIFFVLYLSCYSVGNKGKKFLNRFPVHYEMTLGTYIFLFFLLLQREWGSLVLFFMIYLVFMYIYHPDLKLIGINLIMIAVVGIIGYFSLYHIQVRISTWLDPWSDIENTGYQITQSLFAIASGGFFGTGLGLGHPEFIPEVHSDFIFSAICEELGMFGGIAVILLFFILVYRGMKIAITLTDSYDKSVALGVTVALAFQTFIIIGGVIKFIPLTGITLPFISYGGSSLVCSFASLGILQAISSKSVKM